MDIEKLVRIEAKLDTLIQLVSAMSGKQTTPTGSVQHGNLARLTTKQHAALQMLLSGKSNGAIADRFGVSTNTAKVYVRSIAAKLGVNTRNQIIVMMLDDYKNISEEDYRLISGGLPKYWDRDYEKPDQYAELYATKTR
jgi:DNA-binding CsgD family transcriptional regulator